MKQSYEGENFDASDIINGGDYLRQKLLYEREISAGKIAPSSFQYLAPERKVGLSEISNVDMGYAGTTASNDGEHVSKRVPYLNELEHNVDMMNECDNAVVVLNGGLFTYVPKSNKGVLLSYKDQIAYFYSLFKDLARDGKILALVRGTEEHRILKNHHIDVMGILQDALGLDQKVCNDALIKIAIDSDMVGRADVNIRTLNWNNTATTRSYIARKMEERASLKPGADIYLARTTKTCYAQTIMGQSIDGKKYNRTIHLISSGGYTPFKGAMTAGAEYNSIKDAELIPSSLWYEISVEENHDISRDFRPYVVVVNPVQYLAHQITRQGTDTLSAAINNNISNKFDGYLQDLVDKFPHTLESLRAQNAKELHEVLAKNREIVERNELIRQYKREKRGIPDVVETRNKVVDLMAQSNAPQTITYDDDEELEK